MRDPQTSIQQNATILATIGFPIVLNCPFISYPAANVTWFFNKQPILFDNGYNHIDNRRVNKRGPFLISTLYYINIYYTPLLHVFITFFTKTYIPTYIFI
jgi:hypothetical protein